MNRSDMPVIVCGKGRSGTTFARYLLERCGLHVVSEFRFDDPRFHVPMRVLFAAIQTYSKESFRRVDDPANRIRDLFAAVAFSVTDGNHYDAIRRQSRFALKLPSAELHQRYLERILGEPRPLWVYCLRNGYDTVRSCVMTRTGVQRTGVGPIARSSALVLFHREHWKRSVRVMKRAAASEPGRWFVFQVDRYRDFESRGAHVRDLLSFVGHGEADEEVLDELVRKWAPINPALERGRRHLTRGQRRLLERDAAFGAFLQEFGYDPAPLRGDP